MFSLDGIVIHLAKLTEQEKELRELLSKSRRFARARPSSEEQWDAYDNLMFDLRERLGQYDGGFKYYFESSLKNINESMREALGYLH